MKYSRPLIFVVIMALISSCGNDNYIPKPRGYFRIDFPAKEYRLFDSVCPYTFEVPVYAQVIPDTAENAEPYWFNIEFPQFRGTLYLSYKVVKNNVFQYFEDARDFVTKHIPKADDITTTAFANDSSRVWGVVYNIEGNGVASSYQFCLTDSTQHLLRGALYFNSTPNNDSLTPVLKFIEEDIDHMIRTLKWKG